MLPCQARSDKSQAPFLLKKKPSAPNPSPVYTYKAAPAPSPEGRAGAAEPAAAATGGGELGHWSGGR